MARGFPPAASVPLLRGTVSRAGGRRPGCSCRRRSQPFPVTGLPDLRPAGFGELWVQAIAVHAGIAQGELRGAAMPGNQRPAAPPPGLTSASCPLPARAGWLAHAMEEYAQGYTDPPQGYLYGAGLYGPVRHREDGLPASAAAFGRAGMPGVQC